MGIKKILGILILIGGIVQLVPFGREHDNPPVENEVAWDSEQTKDLFYRACGDCHSNTTKWPWYSNIAPVSWLITMDVQEGRENFNVSMWDVQESNKGRYAAIQLKNNSMPPQQYLLGHPEARLEQWDKDRLIKGLNETFK